uniref:MAT 1.1.3 n=1 Tax=Fusarium azukiicola TaxID=1174670 RepID=A0A075MFC5_9HYPO|nr:MAT 1.1.3 [Fusarium azukiicola]
MEENGHITPEELKKKPRSTELGHLTPPYCLVPLNFVYNEDGSDVHIFLDDLSHIQYVEYVADNFSRRVQEPVVVFHDKGRRKFRLCPGASPDTPSYGKYCYTRNAMELDNIPVPPVLLWLENGLPHSIMRNAWVLYRQAKEPEIRRQNPNIESEPFFKTITDMWVTEIPEVREYWMRLARKGILHYIKKKQEDHAAQSEAPNEGTTEEPSG